MPVPHEPTTDTPACLQGLTDAMAADRLVADGPNSLPGSGPKPFLRIAAGVVREPMFLMLIAAGGIYLAIGDAGEALFLLCSVAAVVGIAVFQERRTQRALEALRDLSAPRALIRRGGAVRRVAAREVVRGDLLLLREGDRVPADAILLSGRIGVDESLLTGEPGTQQKLPGASTQALGHPGQEGSSSIFAGTLVTQGDAQALTMATGVRTAMGRIGAALASATEPASALQRDSRIIVARVAVAGLAIAFSLVLLGWLWDGRPLVESLLLGIALAMAVLPEEIPVVLTVFLAMGAWQLSRSKVLVRRVQAVEALGAITVLAVDKTGTLTVNSMRVAELRANGVVHESGELDDSFLPALRALVLATPADPFDPMEKAILSFAQAHWNGEPVLGNPAHQYAFSRETLAMTNAFAAGTGRYLLATKGAPEAVLDLCGLEIDERRTVQADVDEMARRGLRVLAIAQGEWDARPWPQGQRGLPLRFAGLVGLIDPLRPEIANAVQSCRAAGIRLIMMTGDHPSTALAMAQAAGIETPGNRALAGSDIAEMDDAALGAALLRTNVCARLVPEQKLRLVALLQRAGETVGMTGDGVNDAPALKAADAGIAMGERGTDVAREAAALVLLDDSFASITGAIRQGRQIDDNIRSAVRFIFAVHVPIVALALLPVAAHWPLLLLPAQVVLLELIIDPACSIIFQARPAAPDLMSRPPRDAAGSPFAWRNAVAGLLEGTLAAAVLVTGVAAMQWNSWPQDLMRTTAFLSLAGCVLLLVVMDGAAAGAWKAQGAHRWFAPLLLGVGAVISAVMVVPALRRVLGFAAVSPQGAFAALAMTAAAALALLLLRLGRRKS
jgi:P-type Ca2+ transporter type 2C